MKRDIVLILILQVSLSLTWYQPRLQSKNLDFFPLLFTFSFFLLCVSVMYFLVQIKLSFLFKSYFHNHKHEILVVRLNGKNHSTWAFHFEIFGTGKDLWGHVVVSTPVPKKEIWLHMPNR